MWKQHQLMTKSKQVMAAVNYFINFPYFSCHTDIFVAQKCGMASLLVLTGVSSLDDVDRYRGQSDPESKFNLPDFYCNDLKEFGELL